MNASKLRQMQLNMLDAVVDRIKKYDSENAQLEQEISELNQEISQNKELTILSKDRMVEVEDLVETEAKS